MPGAVVARGAVVVDEEVGRGEEDVGAGAGGGGSNEKGVSNDAMRLAMDVARLRTHQQLRVSKW